MITEIKEEKSNMLSVKHDKEADTVYLHFKNKICQNEVILTSQVVEDILLDFDSRGRLIGLEILNAENVVHEDMLQE